MVHFFWLNGLREEVPEPVGRSGEHVLVRGLRARSILSRPTQKPTTLPGEWAETNIPDLAGQTNS
jgi:hypothetical protein